MYEHQEENVVLSTSMSPSWKEHRRGGKFEPVKQKDKTDLAERWN